MATHHKLASEIVKSAEDLQAAAELRRNLRASANGAKEKAADSLLHTAEMIRSEASKSKNEEVVHQAQVLARSMEKAALYLDSRSVDQLGADAQKVVQENMWPMVGVVLVIGFLLGLVAGSNRTGHRH
jgi:ElaB/YqjD/DUF883 family membrane-anchored ribosome-binding protein